jgi:hypothetical protein
MESRMKSIIPALVAFQQVTIVIVGGGIGDSHTTAIVATMKRSGQSQATPRATKDEEDDDDEVSYQRPIIATTELNFRDRIQDRNGKLLSNDCHTTNRRPRTASGQKKYRKNDSRSSKSSKSSRRGSSGSSSNTQSRESQSSVQRGNYDDDDDGEGRDDPQDDSNSSTATASPAGNGGDGTTTPVVSYSEDGTSEVDEEGNDTLAGRFPYSEDEIDDGDDNDDEHNEVGPSNPSTTSTSPTTATSSTTPNPTTASSPTTAPPLPELPGDRPRTSVENGQDHNEDGATSSTLDGRFINGIEKCVETNENEEQQQEGEEEEGQERPDDENNDAVQGRFENPPCEVCGVGLRVTDLEAIFEYPGQEPTSCRLIEIAGLQGFMPEDICPQLYEYIDPICDCQPVEEVGEEEEEEGGGRI